MFSRCAVKLHEATRMLVIIDCVREVTVKKSFKYGECGSLKHLLFFPFFFFFPLVLLYLFVGGGFCFVLFVWVFLFCFVFFLEKASACCSS